MTTTSNLEHHIKWLQSTEYLKRDPRFEFDFDLSDKFRNRYVIIN